MKFDTMIIGGGLAGMCCGVLLQRSGKHTVMVSSGQGTLHFNSGTLGLLSSLEDGTPIDEPLEGIKQLGRSHPYSKIGHAESTNLAGKIKPFLESCGALVNGSALKNSLAMGPLGSLFPAAFSLEEITLFSQSIVKGIRKVLIINFEGYLDFYPEFIAHGLEQLGIRSRTSTINCQELAALRANPAEMRSTSIARILENNAVLEKVLHLAREALKKDDQALIFPAVFGLHHGNVVEKVRENLPVPVIFTGTMPPSVPGVRLSIQLEKCYKDEGGILLHGDKATKVKLSDSGQERNGLSVESVYTEKLVSQPIQAQNYVLATGSFFSKGLSSEKEHIFETLLGLDLYQCSLPRGNEDFFSNQGFMAMGVKTDNCLHPSLNGRTVENLYAIGSVLGGYDPVAQGCGAGVALVSAMAVAQSISGELSIEKSAGS